MSDPTIVTFLEGKHSFQETYDYVIKKLREQGKPSISDSDICSYRGTDGTKCAIGHLITDKLYRPEFEQLNVNGLVDISPEIKKTLDSNALDSDAPVFRFLCELQRTVHDSWANEIAFRDVLFSLGETVSEVHISGILERLAKQFCEEFKLTYTPPE